MNNHEIMTRGITLLDLMSEGNIDEAIEALEKALEAYRLILKYKRAMKRLPNDFMLLPEKVPVSVKSMYDKVYQYLAQFEGGLECKEIAFKLNITIQQVRTVMNNHRPLFEKIGDDVYKVKSNEHALHNNEVESREDAVDDHSLQS